MSVSLVDALIILIIILGAIVGFKNGVIKEGVKFIGIIVVVLLAFAFKDDLMVILYENLPFFDFFGAIRGLSAINILFYQIIAFLIIFAALTFVLRVLLVITGLIEWLLKLTVFLRGISKFLGIFVGALEYYVYVFIALYILSTPAFNLKYISDSNIGNTILANTPILTTMTDNTINVYTEVWDTIKNKKDKSNEEINKEILITLLDNKLIKVSSAKRLVESNKISIKDSSFLEKYEVK